MKQEADNKTIELPVDRRENPIKPKAQRTEAQLATVPTDPLAKLRAPFAPNQISLLPKPYNKDAPKSFCQECGTSHGQPAVHLEYVGHAALTDRLLDVDPLWSWEPLAFDAYGLPALDADGGMWIKLTVCGVTRLGYGDAQGKKGPNATKERIGDALRNAAMRFGAALDLWHKGILHMDADPDPDQDTDVQPKRPLGNRGFEAALAAVKAGTYTVEQVEQSNALTDDQRDELVAAQMGAKK